MWRNCARIWHTSDDSLSGKTLAFQANVVGSSPTRRSNNVSQNEHYQQNVRFKIHLEFVRSAETGVSF